MPKQFIRNAQVLISGTNGSAETTLDVSGLRITFELTKDLSAYANLCNIQIYNLSEKSRNLISDSLQRVRINVGYGNDLSLLFDGFIRNVFHRREDMVNFVTELYCADGDAYLRHSVSRMTAGESVTLEELIKRLVGDLRDANGGGVSIGELNLLSGSQKIRGYTTHSSTKLALEKLADSYRFNWFIDSGKFYAVSESLPLAPAQVTLITPQTGMIGSPAVTEVGLEVKTLLNPTFAPGRKIQVKSEGTKVQLGGMNFTEVPKRFWSLRSGL